MTISTINKKVAQTGYILPHGTKRGITFDLQEQKVKQQKEHLFRFDMVSNTYTF